MQAKNVLYAAVGAPVVAARKMSDRVNTLKGRVSDETASYTEVASKAIDGWAAEGEKVVSGIRDGKVVEEISHKVDFDQAKEQVSKLRDQLEDMLATWRQSFRPEQSTGSASTEPAPKTSVAKPATKPAAKKPAVKSSAAETTKSSTAAKKSPEKSTSAKGGGSTAKSSS